MSEELATALEAGDRAMREGRAADAQRHYQAAWPLTRALDPVGKVWVLLSLACAALRAGDPEDAFEACAAAQAHFAKSSGVVAGNPLFHLFAGLAYDGLGDSPEQATDHLARALICGGPAIFDGEDSRHLAHLLTILRPPSELGTWEGYEGCSRDLLNGARGFLADLLTERLGAAPPYHYDD
jgi:hypothetical protein